MLYIGAMVVHGQDRGGEKVLQESIPIKMTNKKKGDRIMALILILGTIMGILNEIIFTTEE